MAWIALAWASAATAQEVSPPPGLTLPGMVPAVVPAAAPSDAEVLLAFETAQTRMTVPVTIDAAGPWPFVVDTGAERTVVSRELAGVLKLDAGPIVRVVAMTGAERVPTVMVPSLSVSSIAARGITAPALGARDLGAAGMVGIDALQGHSVLIDFDKQQMSLKPSKKKRRGPSIGRGDVVVSAKSLYGQLIVTDARWRGKRIAVVVDTGTPISIGNPALLQLMTNARDAGGVSLISATGGILTADAVSVNGLEIGGIGFQNVSMAIADAAPFRRFGLGDTPALLMGMDLLRLFRNVQIDFANREIRFTLPRGALNDGAAITGFRS